LIFAGAGTRWRAVLNKPGHPARADYKPVLATVVGVSCGCADVFGDDDQGLARIRTQGARHHRLAQSARIATGRLSNPHVLTYARAMTSSRPVFYTKIGCPWCTEAREVLDRHGIAYVEKVVTTDAAAAAEMQRLSGQTKAPVLDWSGEILADFGAAELEPFLAQRGR